MSRVRHNLAFTLIELLVVISILGMMAAIMAPAIKNFGRADATAAATRQLLDDVGRARQLAISQRTTVWLIFLPASFWTDGSYLKNTAAYLPISVNPSERAEAEKLFDKQLNSYVFFSLRGVGDQPGHSQPRYLSPWRSLPEGTFIAPWKFTPPNAANVRWVIVTNFDPVSFDTFYVKNFGTNSFPFPRAESTNRLWLPYISFNYLGQLDSREDEYIPVGRGTIAHARNPATKIPTQGVPSVSENPPGSSTTDGFNLVHIDWLTGRARIERPQIQ